MSEPQLPVDNQDQESIVNGLQADLETAEIFLQEWADTFKHAPKNQPPDSLLVRTRKWLASRKT